MIKAGIIGDDPYVSIELLRLLAGHPDVELVFVDSEELCGRKVCDVYKGFYGDLDMEFTDKSPLDIIDVLFCCNTAGKTSSYMRETMIPKDLKIIDLSPDYRLPSENSKFVYGLPELNRRATCSSQYVSNPGAVATCVQLALLPLARHLLLNNPVYVNVIAGSSVFGSRLGSENRLSVSSSLQDSDYEEIRHGLRMLQNSFDSEFIMIPVNASFRRGIMATVLTDIRVDLEELKSVYEKYYEKDSFTFLVDDLSLDYVINTNKCFIKLDVVKDRLLVTCCIDNIIKGAVGQAVHNMNLLFNLEEKTGLVFSPFSV